MYTSPDDVVFLRGPRRRRRWWVPVVVVVMVPSLTFLVWFVKGTLDATRAPGSPTGAAVCAFYSVHSQWSSNEKLSDVRECMTDEAADRLIELRRQLVSSHYQATLELGDPFEIVEQSEDRVAVTIPVHAVVPAGDRGLVYQTSDRPWTFSTAWFGWPTSGCKVTAVDGPDVCDYLGCDL